MDMIMTIVMLFFSGAFVFFVLILALIPVLGGVAHNSYSALNNDESDDAYNQ